MENDIVDKPNIVEKIINIIKKKKNTISLVLVLIILSGLLLIFFEDHKKKEIQKISEQYIKAGIHLSNEEKEKSKNIFKKIIKKKNKFYSPLALNIILDNNLEKNEKEILELFLIVEKIDLEKEERNLVKLKKALYLKKIFKEELGNKILNEIISDNSIWKNSALNILEK